MQNIKHISSRNLAASTVAAALALSLGAAHAQQAVPPQDQAQQSMPRGPHMGDQAPAMGQNRPGMGQPGRHRGKDGAQPMPELSLADAYDHVQAAGYRDVREIELEKGRWEVKALDAEGNPVKLYVSGSSGAIEYVKRKGDGQRWPDRLSGSSSGARSPTQRQYGAGQQAVPHYDHAMRPVANQALPGTSAWGWHYYSAPAALRAVVISPAGDYYFSQGDGLRWIHSAKGRDAPVSVVPVPAVLWS